MIAAVILAAGESKRMGRPKLVLPWGPTTVIGQVIRTVHGAGIQDILVVTGGAHRELEEALGCLEISQDVNLRTILNKAYGTGEMLSSIKLGLSELGDQVEAALILLGDQPQVEPGVIRAILDIYNAAQALIVMPSYRFHRGHPWLIDRSLWRTVVSLGETQTMRDFFYEHASHIHYVNVDTPSILKDLDTPEDYRRELPG
jgi:molybdenum cofactor cytidylyltransferase